jgi:HEPN domain-containing protein
VIPAATLRDIAAARLDDARHLLAAGRFDGAAYLCGYAVELALKARICDTLGWSDFPERPKEFQPYQSLKTHNLEILLTFTGQQQNVKTNHLDEWSKVAVWDPESRYKPTGTIAQPEAQLMIDSAVTLLGVL